MLTNTLNITAVALIAAGVLALVYGGFSYTRETHEAVIGPLQLAVDDKQRINIPVWAGIGVIAVGGVLLLAGRRK